MVVWLLVALAAVVVLGALALRSAGRPGSAREDAGSAAGGAGGPEMSHREKLARSAGIASFGLNLPWWVRTESGKRHGDGRRG
jgi:hypothetical protein